MESSQILQSQSTSRAWSHYSFYSFVAVLVLRHATVPPSP
jgi:hypothetical protein